MFTLKGRRDGFKLTLPKEFLPKVIEEKYSKIINQNRSFIIKPIDFLNETIQAVDVLGFNEASINQSQPGGQGYPLLNQNRIKQNEFMHMANDVAYRSPNNPQMLIDKTLNITFKHTLGFVNYFMLFESFLYMYSRDMEYKDMPQYISIELFDRTGTIYSRIMIEHPIIDGIDMLSFDYTKPVAESDTFKLVIKYSVFDYQFISTDSSNWNGEVE